MKILVPDYYSKFRCIAGRCRHTCCKGWEIDVDEESLPRFLNDTFISPHVELSDTPHIRLEEDEKCPFLRADGLCEMIVRSGEKSLCQICRDHPRFRNFWTGITEIGLGFVCGTAAELILGWPEKMKLTVLEDDGAEEPVPDDEQWLINLRCDLLEKITDTGPHARLREYLIYRHLADALYDGRVDERIRFIDEAYSEITGRWKHTDGSLPEIAEAARQWSYDVEYDEEVLEKRISGGLITD